MSEEYPIFIRDCEERIRLLEKELQLYRLVMKEAQTKGFIPSIQIPMVNSAIITTKCSRVKGHGQSRSNQKI